MTEEDIKKLQSTGGEALAATEKNILGNDLPKLWELVSNPNFGKTSVAKGGRIDFSTYLLLLSIEIVEDSRRD